MANSNVIPTADTLLEQVGRWLALHMGVNAAAPYVASEGDQRGFPRGVGFADPANGALASHEFRGRLMVWHGPLPDSKRRPLCTGGAWLSISHEAVPTPAGGIDVPSRVIGVRLWCEATTRQRALEVLSDAARVFGLPGYGSGAGYPGGGRRFVYAQAGLSAAALLACRGDGLGLIGVPPPASIGVAGVPMWRVISVAEYAPPQVLSDAIGAAGVAAIPGDSGGVSASMVLAFTVTQVTGGLAQPSLAFNATIPVGKGDLGNDAALRVFRAADGTVKIEGATFIADGATHAYSTYSGSTVSDIASALSSAGWSITSSSAAALARPAADLVLTDWRRARTSTPGGGDGGGVVNAGVYVHGVAAPGGGT